MHSNDLEDCITVDLPDRDDGGDDGIEPIFHKRIAALDMALRWAEHHAAGGTQAAEIVGVAEEFHAFLSGE